MIDGQGFVKHHRFPILVIDSSHILEPAKSVYNKYLETESTVQDQIALDMLC